MKAMFLSAMVGIICSCSSSEDELAEKGGHIFSLNLEERMDNGGAKIPVTGQEVEQTMRVVEGRLEAMGIARMSVTREGEDGIMLKVPGVGAEEAGRIIAMLEKTSRLGLHGVSSRNDEVNGEGITLAQRVLNGEEIVPGFRAYRLRGKDADGNDSANPILINRRMALGGEDIAVAVASPRRPDSVEITLNGSGTDKMVAFTKDMRPSIDRIAIVLDGEVITAPVITQTPLGKNFIITGLHEPGEAQALAISLMHPLVSALKVVGHRQIPPKSK